MKRELAQPSRLWTPQAEDAPVSSEEQLDVLWLASALVVPVALVFAVGVAVVAQVTLWRRSMTSGPCS